MILVVKPLVAFLIVILGGHSLRTALTVAGGLAQIGEFSFIVADLAGGLGWMPDAGRNSLIAGAIVSISLNPWLFKRLLAMEPGLSRIRPLKKWTERRHQSRRRAAHEDFANHPAEANAITAIVVGYGPAGQTVAQLLQESGVVPIVVETNLDTVEEINDGGGRALFGDASRPDILEAAGISQARYLIITVPKAEITLQVIHAGRVVNPQIEVLARASYLRDRAALEAAGASKVCVDEAEAAVELAQTVMEKMSVPKDQARDTVSLIRDHFDRRI